MAKNYDELNPDANVKVGIPEKVGRGLRSAAIETGTGLANSARGWGILGNAAIIQPAKGFARGLAGSPTAPSQTPPSAPRTSAQRASIPQVPVPTNSSERPVFNGSGQPVYVSSMTAQPAAQLPQGRAMTDAPAAIPLTDRAMTDVNPALAAAPRARTVVPQRAILDVNAALEAQPALPVGRDVYGNVQYTPAMTSPAALRLQQRMNATNEARSLGFQPGSARAMQLQSQWDEAARAAFTGAMTPQQQAAYEREQAAERMRQGAAFRETPQYQMGEQGIRRDVGVADAQARGLIGASATRAEQERLNRETMTANERMRQEGEMGRTAMTTAEQRAGRMDVATERRASAEDTRKANETTRLGEQIAKLYASPVIGSGTDAEKNLMSRIAKLEAQHDKLLGIAEGAVPVTEQAASPLAGVAAATVGAERKYTASEAKALPVGTIYIGTDGVKRTR